MVDIVELSIAAITLLHLWRNLLEYNIDKFRGFCNIFIIIIIIISFLYIPMTVRSCGLWWAHCPSPERQMNGCVWRNYNWLEKIEILRGICLLPLCSSQIPHQFPQDWTRQLSARSVPRMFCFIIDRGSECFSRACRRCPDFSRNQNRWFVNLQLEYRENMRWKVHGRWNCLIWYPQGIEFHFPCSW
jgi:hypothetical protein